MSSSAPPSPTRAAGVRVAEAGEAPVQTGEESPLQKELPRPKPPARHELERGRSPEETLETARWLSTTR